MSDFKRNCPSCKNVLSYQSKGALSSAISKNSICRKCASEKSGFTARYATKGANSGSDNYFYGKHHTEESKLKITKNKDFSPYRTEEFRNKISVLSAGENNPMYGKTVYDTWVEKYGQEEADRRDAIKREKLSLAARGKNNPMYGKPSPKKAGNGWSGWYKKWFFRSLRELSYMINVIEKNNHSWESCEKLFRIDYIDWDGSTRTYSPDFLVDNKLVVEIKPKRLHNSSTVLAKQKYAIEFCSKNGYEYLITDVVILDIEILEDKIVKHEIIFTDKTKEKYEQFKAKKTNNSKGNTI